MLRFTYPADAVLKHYFREQRRLGPKDRSVIAETIYTLLRRRLFIEHLAQGAESPRLLLMIALTKLQGVNVKELGPVTRPHERALLTKILETNTDHLPLPVETDFPDWLVQIYLKDHSRNELLALAHGLQAPAPLDLRVNTMHTNRANVIEMLQAEELEPVATPHSPLGVRLMGKPALQKHPLLINGHVEVQDEGSQLLGLLVAPRRNEMVVDFCAGAGGKTLLLGALMHSTGRLYAFDVSEKRLQNLKPRLKRSGLSNVQPVRIEHENDARIKRLARKIDRVLVDAPCSGLGTLRRNPDLKWRQTADDIAELAIKQKNILVSAARLLKPGGRLVYATCSILNDENEAIVTEFLSTHADFKLLNCAEILAAQHVNIDTGEYLYLYPHQHGTDGFFAAVMEKLA